MIILNSIYNRFKSFSLWLLQLFRFWTSSSNYHGFWPLGLLLYFLPRNKIKPWCDEPLAFFPSRHSLSFQEYRESGREESKQWTEFFISEQLLSQELSLIFFPKCLPTHLLWPFIFQASWATLYPPLVLPFATLRYNTSLDTHCSSEIVVAWGCLC